MAFPLLTSAGALIAGLLLVVLDIGWVGAEPMLRERLFLVGLNAVILGWLVGGLARALHRGAKPGGDGRAFWTGLACGIAPWNWFAAGFALASVAAAWRRPLPVPARAARAVGIGAHLLLLVVALWPAHREVTPLAGPTRDLPSAASDAPVGAGPDVLLVVVDTLRADAILDPAVATPHLDALRARGMWADAAVAPCNQTLPSHMALLAALDIERTGMRSNLSRWPTRSQLRDELSMVPLAERFAGAGYRTAAVVSNALLSSVDVEAGLQGFDDGFEAWHGMERVPSWLTFRDWYRRYTLFGLLTPKKHISWPLRHLLAPTPVQQYREHYDEGRRTTDAALPWLAELQQGEAPYFFLLHYMDPHSPYLPPDGFAGTLATGEERPAGFAADATAELAMRVHLLDPILAGAEMPEDSAQVAAFLHDLYREEVASLDAQLGRVLAQVEASGRPTVVLFTSDHGEQFLDHGWTEHSHTLYDEELLVPFVLAGPGVPEGVRLEALPELVDAGPTLLALAGLPTDATGGSDLLAAEIAPPRGVLSVMIDVVSLREARWKLHARMRYLDAKNPRPDEFELTPLHLYDLLADPGETRDLLAAHPGEAERMQLVLRARLANDLYPELEERQLSDAHRAKLEQLGYAGLDDDHKH